MVATMRALARLNILPGMPLPNATRGIYALLDEPLVGDTIDQLPQATLEEIMQVCADAERTLGDNIASTRDPLSIEEMAFSARLMAYAARKVLTSQQVRSILAALPAGQSDTLTLLRQAIEAFRSLDAELVELSQVFRHLWLRRARHAEIGITLGHFARLREHFAVAREWLRALVAQIEAGETSNAALYSYAENARSYEILGQGRRRRWRELGLTPG